MPIGHTFYEMRDSFSTSSSAVMISEFCGNFCWKINSFEGRHLNDTQVLKIIIKVLEGNFKYQLRVRTGFSSPDPGLGCYFRT